jgi:hypothetical protein
MVHFTNLLIICKLFTSVIIYTWKKGLSLRFGILEHQLFSIACEHILARKSTHGDGCLPCERQKTQ